jgi:hypothetical protein
MELRMQPWANMAIRLADEGVPISAIARASQHRAVDVRSVLKGAMDSGLLVEMPAEDWPPNTRRDMRAPTLPPIRMADLESVAVAVQLTFRLSPGKSRFLAVLLIRGEASRPTIMQAIRFRDRPDASPKIVDVYAMNIRHVLARYDLTMKTIWGRGFALSQKARQRIIELIAAKNQISVPDAA